MSNQEEKKRVAITYAETKDLREICVEDVFEQMAIVNALKRGGMVCLGDVLDNINNLKQPFDKKTKKYKSLSGFGDVKVKVVRNTVWNYLLTEGYVRDVSEVK